MANAVKARTPSSRRRDFRLSPLETMILGLILVVAIYLISAWVRGADGPAPTPVTEVPGSQLERALAATEAVQAQISSLVKEIDALRQEVNSQGGGKDKGKPMPVGFSKRLAQLESRVDKLAQGAQPASSDSQARLLHRVEKLERALSRGDRLPPPPPARPATPERKTSAKPGEKHPSLSAAPPAPKPSPTERVSSGTPSGPRVIYKVRRGNTLGGVARQFHVRSADILEWNPKLQKRKYLWVGEKLLIYPGPDYKP